MTTDEPHSLRVHRTSERGLPMGATVGHRLIRCSRSKYPQSRYPKVEAQSGASGKPSGPTLLPAQARWGHFLFHRLAWAPNPNSHCLTIPARVRVPSEWVGGLTSPRLPGVRTRGFQSTTTLRSRTNLSSPARRCSSPASSSKARPGFATPSTTAHTTSNATARASRTPSHELRSGPTLPPATPIGAR